MKKLLLLIVLTVVASVSFAQVTPEAFIGMLPAIPTNECSMKIAEHNKYISYVDSVLQLIGIEQERRNNEMNANADVTEKQVLDNTSKKFGLSEEDMKKLQNDKGMTEEEKNALINKALQNSANISLDEVKNLDKMDKAGQDSWANAYGTEKMAEAQANPDNNQKQQGKAKSLYELTTMQKHILDSLTAVETKFGKQFADLDNDPEAKVMLDNIAKLNKEASDLMGEGDNAGMNKMSELNSEKEKYCSKYTPKYVDLLKKYESYTKSCLPVCYRLENISAQQTQLQTGVKMKQQPGLIGIGKVADYLHLLRGVVKYNLIKE